MGERQNLSECEADSHTHSCSFCSRYTWLYSVPSSPLYPISSWSLCRSHPQSFSENLSQASVTRPNQHMCTPRDIPLTHIEITSLHLCDYMIMIHLPLSFIRTGTISCSAHHDISRASPVHICNIFHFMKACPQRFIQSSQTLTLSSDA